MLKDPLDAWRSEEIPVGTLAHVRGEGKETLPDLVALLGDGPFRITRSASGAVLRLALPLVSRTDVDLARNGDELVVTVGSYRRLLTLPSGLTLYIFINNVLSIGQQIYLRRTLQKPPASGQTVEVGSSGAGASDRAKLRA